ncbi:hypothetical protein EST38_g13400 [Candolleomyces aberdarensis]|uniref:DNA 3'-5' helicase n=1 Tax=Candolleomyces aberdarensis TaxID=2316362 RepID=A0A4Q2D1W7_9AGAR|nr:hypothetical protein EST38_g13400 [Candolleomyces aberdarensis]
MIFFNTIEKKVVRLLEDDVLRGLDCYANTKNAADNLQSTDKGYSFLADSSNDFYQSRLSLGAQLLDNDRVKARFFHVIPGTTELTLNVKEALNWLQKLAECEALLALLIEMRSGSPIRLTELMSTLATNTRYRTRNLFAIGKHTVLVRQYNKTSNNDQADRLIPHALSSFDADVLAQIHLLARPFASFLASKVFSGDPEVARMYVERLFMDIGKAFTSRKLSDLMGKETLLVFLFRMTISMWRHIATAWRTKLCEPTDVDDEISSLMKQVQAQQSGHSLATEQRIYGLSPDVIEGISDANVQLYVQVSVEWQKRLQVVPGGLDLTYREAMMDNFDSLVEAGVIKFGADRGGKAIAGSSKDETIQLLQQLVIKQSHTHEVLVGKLGVLHEEVTALKKALLNGTNRPLQRLGSSAVDTLVNSPHPPNSVNLASSSTTHDRAALDNPDPRSAAEVLQLSKRKRDESPIQDTHTATDSPAKRKTVNPPRRAIPRNSDMLEHLRHILRRQVNWSHPGQQMAVEVLLKLQQDALIILRTGIGKSIIAILPTLVEDWITIILIPLVVLMEDWKRRLEEMGVPFQEFNPHNPRSITGSHNIILLSPDKGTFDSWPHLISEINQIRPVVRLVVDETHLWFTDNAFRQSALSNPSALRLFPMQVVLLSATVSPAAEKWLTEQFALVNPSVIRGLSHRAELKIIVMTGYESSDEMVDALEAYLERVKEELEWGEKDRFIAYSNFHDVAKSIADRCGVEIYQAKDGKNRVEHEKRRAIYGRFERGERPGLVATTALSAGTDYSHIRVTCHVGMPFDLVTFVQQASRAGRDGKPAHCVILATQGPTSSKSHLNHLRGVQELRNMVFGSRDRSDLTPRCARWHIGNFLDGQGFTCRDFGPGWQVCSSCEPGLNEHSTNFYTGNALAHVNPPYSYPSLTPPSRLPPEIIRQQLSERFQKAVETGQQVATEAKQRQAVKNDPYDSVLLRVGRNCGVCLMRNVAVDHPHTKCPNLTDRQASGDVIYKVRYAYRGYTHPPCYKCHISSMGGNSLHGNYTTGEETATCKHPHLMKGLLAEIWFDPDLREKVQKHFKVRWVDIVAYRAWVVEPDAVHSTKSMALVIWFGETYLDG